MKRKRGRFFLFVCFLEAGSEGTSFTVLAEKY